MCRFECIVDSGLKNSSENALTHGKWACSCTLRHTACHQFRSCNANNLSKQRYWDGDEISIARTSNRSQDGDDKLLLLGVSINSFNGTVCDRGSNVAFFPHWIRVKSAACEVCELCGFWRIEAVRVRERERRGSGQAGKDGQ